MSALPLSYRGKHITVYEIVTIIGYKKLSELVKDF